MHFDLTATQIRDGSYPLHMALEAHAPTEVVELLVEKGAEMLLKTNKFGETPLHVALKHQAPNDVLLKLLKREPEAVQICDTEHGNTPAHTATRIGCSVSLAQALINAWPSVLHMTNAEGLRPLEVGLSSGACSEEVLALFETRDGA